MQQPVLSARQVLLSLSLSAHKAALRVAVEDERGRLLTLADTPVGGAWDPTF